MTAAFVSVEDLVATLVTNPSVPGPMVAQWVGDSDDDVLEAAVEHLARVATVAGRPLELAVLHGDRRDVITVLPGQAALVATGPPLPRCGGFEGSRRV